MLSHVMIMHSILTALRFHRMWRAYVDDRPFSFDLVDAVIRQCTFIDEMHNLGWLKPEFFNDEDNDLVLLHCLGRYHA